MFKQFSRLDRAFMLPISTLPVADLLLGLGGALSNESAVKIYLFLDQAWLQTVLKIMGFAGNAFFSNLALISIGISVRLVTSDKGTTGLASGVSFLVYTATISGLLELFSPKGYWGALERSLSVILLLICIIITARSNSSNF